MNTKAYLNKQRDQWTPDDVAEAIADGYYLQQRLEDQSTKYLLNRHNRLCKVMNSAYSIAAHRGTTAAAVWSKYGPETLAIERILKTRIQEAA